MKNAFALAVLTSFISIAAHAEIKIPEGYEPILQCEAVDERPAFAVARLDGDFYLAAKVGRKVKLFQLEGTTGDEGYDTFAPKRRKDLGELDAYVGYVTIDNDANVEDEAKRPLTGGNISMDDADDQECEVVGEPLRN